MKSSRDTGATLLSVLLIVFLMSAAALTATEMLARSIETSKIANGRSASHWAIRGAAIASASLTREVLKKSNGRLTETSPFLRDPIVIPLENASLSVEFKDASNCLNLNSLLTSEPVGEISHERATDYFNLLLALGFFDGEARNLTDSLSDWLDADTQPRPSGAEDSLYQTRDIPHRAASQPLHSIAELAAIEHYTSDVLERISPFVCARTVGAQAPLNINTIDIEQGELLSALFSAEITPAEAVRLIEQRPSNGWPNLDAFFVEDEVIKIAPLLRRDTAISIVSHHVYAHITAIVPTGRSDFSALIGGEPTKDAELISLSRKPPSSIQRR